MKATWLFILAMGCAPTTRIVTKKCPVPVTAVLVDFFIGVAALGVSALKSNVGKDGQSFVYTSIGTGLIAGSFISEWSCLK